MLWITYGGASGGCCYGADNCQPGHMKRVVAALNENIAKYEQKFGEIETAEAPKVNMGFKQ